MEYKEPRSPLQEKVFGRFITESKISRLRYQLSHCSVLSQCPPLHTTKPFSRMLQHPNQNASLFVVMEHGSPQYLLIQLKAASPMLLVSAEFLPDLEQIQRRMSGNKLYTTMRVWERETSLVSRRRDKVCLFFFRSRIGPLKAAFQFSMCKDAQMANNEQEAKDSDLWKM
jgi:hypothetical protein